MTKRQHVRSSWADKIRRGGSVAAAIGVMGTLAVAASGCDTVALISFSERSFTNIHAAGFTPPKSSVANADACNGVNSDGGDMRVRFVLADNDGKPIQLGETVDNQAVELTHESVELTDSRLMEVSDTGACSSNDECSASFTCDTAPGIQDASLKACLSAEESLGVAQTTDGVSFISNTSEHQLYGILMERSGSLSGWNPPGSQGAWDKNSDGDTSDPEDVLPQNDLRAGEDIATDWHVERFGAVRQTRRPWENAHEAAKTGGRKTYFGLWSFNDANAQPTSYVREFTPTESQWTNDGGVVQSAISDYANLGDPRGQRANVYEAITNVIENQYSSDSSAVQDLGLERAAEIDKQLVVFVDGYDDLRSTDDTEIEDVIQAATDNNVRLFILHLDPKLGEPASLREDPMYPSMQTECTEETKDSLCKNFEECVKPRGYAPSQGESVVLPDGANYVLDKTYCIPRRDDFGRTGPIDDYARLACATGGGYMYIPSAEAIASNISWTPLALDGLWEAQLSSTVVDRGNAPTGQPLRVHSNMRVTVAGRSRNYSFSQTGNLGTGSDSDSDDFDNRGVVFTADE